MFYHARSTDFKKKIERVYEQARNWYQRWFEEMEHEFPLSSGNSQDYLFRCSVAPGNFPFDRPQKGFSGNVL